jgi:hypothetical protein
LRICPSSAPYIRILIVKDKPALVDLFIDLLTGVLQSFKLDTATDADRVVPGVGYAQRASDTPGREALATGESVRGDGLKTGNLSVEHARAPWHD